MHNGKTNGKVHMYSDKQITVDFDTIVPEGGAIFVSCHVNS